MLALERASPIFAGMLSPIPIPCLSNQQEILSRSCKSFAKRSTNGLSVLQ